MGDGIARPDPLGLGLATDTRSRVIGANGTVHENLFALGALSRGVRFETTAIPEISEQVDAMAREILHRAQEVARAPAPPVSVTLPTPQSATIVAFAGGSPR
jgi:uncharacterized NAD(P)/FAD-binding protein YdhS